MNSRDESLKFDWKAFKKRQAVDRIIKKTVYGITDAQNLMCLCTSGKYKRDSRVVIKMSSYGMSIDKIEDVLKAVNK